MIDLEKIGRKLKSLGISADTLEVAEETTDLVYINMHVKNNIYNIEVDKLSLTIPKVYVDENKTFHMLGEINND